MARITFFLAILGAAFATSACEQPATESVIVAPPTFASIDDELQLIADETGLPIIDVSVPFERFAEAPSRLQRIAGALNSDSAGLYTMYYYDDTLRFTYHIFANRQSEKLYIELTSFPAEQPIRVDFEISGAEYDEPTSTLTLQTPTRSIRLTAADVTPVGA